MKFQLRPNSPPPHAQKLVDVFKNHDHAIIAARALQQAGFKTLIRPESGNRVYFWKEDVGQV